MIFFKKYLVIRYLADPFLNHLVLSFTFASYTFFASAIIHFIKVLLKFGALATNRYPAKIRVVSDKIKPSYHY